MNKKIRPIIKWTGGKFDEFSFFANQIPSFTRYIEPFFGGGGVFFALQPNVASFINDKSTDLFNFYVHLSDETFKTELFKYVSAWEALGTLNTLLWDTSSNDFKTFISGANAYDDLKDNLSNHIKFAIPKISQLFDIEFIVDAKSFETKLLASILDKAKRIKRISDKEGRSFSESELQDHFETGIRSGFYLFFRNLLNQQYTKSIQLSPAKTVANWYFVREFCYASMFRFNSKGEFNIPYGGIAYNKKNFRLKVTNVFDDSIANLFKNVSLSNLDFEDFLNTIELNPNDFIFLDPPYDSEFSEYDQNSFSQNDQKRLASFLIKTTAKWMVVIKETDFIRNIYTHPNINITTFDKNYTYNVRGRNNRSVTHLIVTNY
jgi:DNA adenine methylase